MRRVEQLRLLSKAEQAGLLSLAERNGLTLSFIERSGLLSKAESLGLLTAATDRCDSEYTGDFGGWGWWPAPFSMHDVLG